MTKRVWKVLGLAMALMLVVGASTVAAQGGPVNTLRVYGRCTENANFPYETVQGPFDLTSPEAPPKDFIQWNPAFLYHLDRESNGIYGNFFGKITTNNDNASEKVHLRQWYVPKYREPSGLVWIPLEADDYEYSPDIVKEYTYILLDAQTNDPDYGLPGSEMTQFAFPIADNDDLKPAIFDSQIGLDDWDVNNDDEADIVQLQTLGEVETWFPPKPAGAYYDPLVGNTWMDISTKRLSVQVGDEIRFLDHRIVVEEIVPSVMPNPGIVVDVYYQGERDDAASRNKLADDIIIPFEATLSAGRHNWDVEMLSNSPPNPPSRSAEFIAGAGATDLELIKQPWYVQVRSVGDDSARIIVGRLLTTEEAFFVDGAEYEVAAIHTPYLIDRNAVEQEDEFLGQCDVGGATGPYGPVSMPNPDGTYFADCDGDGDVDTDDVRVYVDGNLRDVANINRNTGEIELADPCCCSFDITIDYCYESPAFKYVTIRNGLPKFQRIWFDSLSLWKEAVQPHDPLPLLPPFNMEHDVIDDVNIDEIVPEIGDVPDEQLPDNLATGIAAAYDTIAERRVEDQAAAVEFFIAEEKEERFDTNLFEEKFTVPDEEWAWINIETLPWHYTEFVLPEIEDATATDEDGDYILVSSFITEDSDDVWEVFPANKPWHDEAEGWDDNKLGVDNPGGAVRAKFYFDAAGADNGLDVYVNDDVDPAGNNSLRVYGLGTMNAAFPYLTEQGPFDLTSGEAPPKDFIVWNPAYHSELEGVVVNGADANEKVHLRQWYVPEYVEPSGEVWEDQATVSYADIVKEYTYLLLDHNNDPVLGLPSMTDFYFPVADRMEFDPANPATQQYIGLDSYDYDGDGVDDLVHLEGVGLDSGAPYFNPFVDLSTGVIGVQEGDVIEFLDHRIEIVAIDSNFPGPRVEVDIYYTGNRIDDGLGLEQVFLGDMLSAGRHDVNTNPANRQFVDEPWYMEVNSILGGNRANITVGRWLLEEEAFFVDGAEYEVAKIHTDGDGLKYITIRNGLPKCEDVPDALEPITFEVLSIVKQCVVADEFLPFLPPFNMVHTMVDDVNIPEYVMGDPNLGSWADLQLPDNPAVDAVLGYQNIADRLIPGVGPIEEYYVVEDKEPRFDTNLLEEKFTEPDEVLRMVAKTLGQTQADEVWRPQDGEGFLEYLPCGDDFTFRFEGMAPDPNTEYTLIYYPDKAGDPWPRTDIICLESGTTDANGYIELSGSVDTGALPKAFDLNSDPATTTYDDGSTGAKIWLVPTADVDCAVPEEMGGWNPDSILFETRLINYDPDAVCSEDWMWINIETHPWDYTEFVLPELPDIAAGDVTVGAKWWTGDYILVSSWMTEDSEDVWEMGANVVNTDTVRMKFVYDAVDGTGIYINRKATTANPLDVDGDGDVDFQDVLEVLKHWGARDTDPGWGAHDHADVNDDGFVNILDIGLVLDAYLNP